MTRALISLPAVELARRIRRREVSPVEVVEAHIARIEAVNPSLNAVVVDTFDSARRQARQAEEALDRGRGAPANGRGELFGVPFTVKEMVAVEGLPHTAGVLARRGVRAPSDAPLVQRLRAAGAILLGLTNTSEAGLWLESSNPIYGRTNNPHDLRRISGGSTGGEGAIIAAGGSPIGIGADIGGSIRNPCFFNGICGHKPTGGLLPSVGHWPPAEGQRGRYCVLGPMGRTVADLVALMEVFSPPEDPYRDAGQAPFRPLSGLRPEQVTVYWFDAMGPAPVDRDVAGSVRRTADALSDQGFRVVRWRPEGLGRGAEVWGAKVTTTEDHSVRELLGDGQPIPLAREWLRTVAGRPRHSLISLVMATFERAAAPTPARTGRLIDLAAALQHRIESRLGGRGVLVCPVYPSAAPRHRAPLARPLAFAYCGVFNVLELPATAVPTGSDRRGLPIGVQVVGRRFDDPLTLWVAEHIERWSGGWRPALS